MEEEKPSTDYRPQSTETPKQESGINIPTSPAEVHEVPEESVAMPKKTIILFPTVILMILISVFAGYLLYQNYLLKQQITSLNSQIIKTPSPTPTASQAPNGDMTGWKTYTDKDYNFSVKYPSVWSLESETENSSTTAIKLIVLDPNKTDLKGTKQSPQPLSNQHKRTGLVNIQITPHKNINNYMYLQGLLKFPDEKIGFEYLIDTKKIDEYTPTNAQNNPNEHYIGYAFDRENQYLFEISFQADKEHEKYLENFNQILSTFRFLGSKQVNYTCPSNGWVDCMPVLSEETKQFCTQEAYSWYKENCPNFQGFAQ